MVHPRSSCRIFQLTFTPLSAYTVELGERTEPSTHLLSITQNVMLVASNRMSYEGREKQPYRLILTRKRNKVHFFSCCSFVSSCKVVVWMFFIHNGWGSKNGLSLRCYCARTKQDGVSKHLSRDRGTYGHFVGKSI